ncbi:G-type lectin S-receptor-like serine/threonine-protein kinase SRK [Triticum urartu]|uniref:non-specific serine/threonine protein kinase n=1 Tax=Triticum urartu TaxID=4572 RepID=M8ACX5_TRIUA|nr:G-type lectin S-receptor-like serine/threonine-protein kinase SRK [Triticum urartu]
MGAGRRPGATSWSSVSPRSRAAGLHCCLASSQLSDNPCFCSAVSPDQFLPFLPPDLTARGPNPRLLTPFYSASSDALQSSRSLVAGAGAAAAAPYRLALERLDGVVPDDGRVIAVKKLQENAPMPPDKTFNNEVQNIMALKHENVVELVGFCWETQKKLVQFDGRYIQADITESVLCYEYLPNGSLQQNLFGTKTVEAVSSAEPVIDWATRFKIIKGICQGLLFLHKLDIPIIHMDLKPENILLDENMVPKIADFGLSRVFGQEQTRLYTQTVVGSYGYMAPEYLYRDTEGLHQVKICIELGLKCAEIDRRVRPPIEEIVDTLNGLRANEMANEVPHASPVSKKMGFLGGFKKK